MGEVKDSLLNSLFDQKMEGVKDMTDASGMQIQCLHVEYVF